MDCLSYITIGLITLFTLLYLFVKNKYSYWKSRNVPFVEPSFPFGNLKGLGTKSHPAQVFQSLYIKLKDSGSKFVEIYSFLQPMPQ